MKEPTFIIKCRYQTWSNNNIIFTDWFVYDPKEYTEQTGKEQIKFIKKEYEFIDKKTHLKHEYTLVPYEEYVAEQKEIEKNIKAAQKRDEKYFASDEWKDLKHKKYVARKERKQHQEEYLEMMKQLENKN